MNPSKTLFGLNPLAQPLQEYIASLADPLQDVQEPEVKSYPDAVYLNYYTLGCSFLFKPIDGYNPALNLQAKELKNESLILDSIDLYNSTGTSRPKSRLTREYSTYARIPLIISIDPQVIEVTCATTGKEFVEWIGEPDRKGGGAGPASGGINIWMEWSKVGIMVELGGEEARGPEAWEKGKDAVWKVITLYKN